MKVDAQTLKMFIKKASLNGSILTMNLDFREDGLYSKTKDITDVAATEVFLPAEYFEDYKPVGEMFVKNTIYFKKYIDTFGGEVEIERVEEYALKISDDTREAVILMGAEIVFNNIMDRDLPNVETVSSFKATRRDLERTYKDLGFVDTKTVDIYKNEKDVTFVVGNKEQTDVFKNIIPLEESENTTHVGIGPIFKSLYESLDGEFEAFVEENKPLTFIENVDGINFRCVIAPVTGSND